MITLEVALCMIIPYHHYSSEITIVHTDHKRKKKQQYQIQQV